MVSNIRNFRVRKNLSQEDLAARLGIDRTTVTKWETGESLPRAEKLPRIAAILGCTVDELLAVDDK